MSAVKDKTNNLQENPWHQDYHRYQEDPVQRNRIVKFRFKSVIIQYNYINYNYNKKNIIDSQGVQQLQQVQSYQAHHGLPEVPLIHGLQRGQSLPARGLEVNLDAVVMQRGSRALLDRWLRLWATN